MSKKHWEGTTLVTRILQRCKSRAAFNRIEFDLKEEDITIPYCCPILKTPFVYGHLDYAASIDRIDPTKGYVKGNVQIISNKANRMKSDATNEELKLFAEWIRSEI